MTASLLSIFQLNNIPRLGLATYWKLLDHFGSVEDLLKQPNETLRTCLKPDLAKAIQAIQHGTAETKSFERTIQWCEQHQVQLISHEDPSYPQLLRQICRRPPLLYVKGELSSLNNKQVAIVGARNSSETGRLNAASFARELGEFGFTITSGLALGIDACAHRGALEAKAPTLAVIGSGIDRVYPYRNIRLADEIVAKGGALISEFPIGSPPSSHNFPQRNRIISGLSLGTLVIEAAIKSGSLITARVALEQNREVFAVPGSIHNPKSCGCNTLIKNGAHLAESAEDIVFALAGESVYKSASKDHEPNKESAAGLLKLVEFDPMPLEAIVEKSQLDAAELLSQLMDLEMEGQIAQNGSGYYRIR